MRVEEKEILISRPKDPSNLLGYIEKKVLENTSIGDIPIRFVITCSDRDGYHCEIGIITDTDKHYPAQEGSIFNFRKRTHENTDSFNVALLIPTGIGAEIGGHCGDAGPVARLIAGIGDNLITHPNVVNAADINELPQNALYVEGSVISNLMMGTVALQKVRSNRVLLILDDHRDNYFVEAAVNSVSAARAAFGLDCPLVIKMNKNVIMRSLYSRSGRASGSIEGLEYLIQTLEKYRNNYDAVALSSLIRVPENFHEDYFKADIVNPWGGVEAMLTHSVSILLNTPSAHSPMMSSREIQGLKLGIVDPRKSADTVSTTYLHCILKGLHKSPRIIKNPQDPKPSGLITVSDIACLVIPDGCIGLPVLAALEQGIPVIAVRENRNKMRNRLDELPFRVGGLYIVENYLEAAGLLTAFKNGIAAETLRRPLVHTGFFCTEMNEKEIPDLNKVRFIK